jgi:hypothetical protein
MVSIEERSPRVKEFMISPALRDEISDHPNSPVADRMDTVKKDSD